ncbi:MAG: glucosamine-6-phosphate deaminase [Suipraeoptans sp.]
MKVYITKDLASLSLKAADQIAAQIIMKPDCTLGLATGSTPIETYNNLVKKYEDGVLDFNEVKSVNLDEYRGISRDSSQSYYYFMNDNLFHRVNIKAENTNIPNGEEPNAEKECRRYEQLIKDLGGIDLQLLGIGHNGHIGFNEPAEYFNKDTHCVDLQEKTIEANKRFFESADQVPRQAYTMGINTIMQARKVLVIASGADKADIVKEAFCGPITPKVPASILQLHSDLTVIVDKAAGKHLD